MSVIMDFLARNKLARRAVFVLLGGTALFTAVALLWIRVGYAILMPQSPVLQTGRVYRTMVAFGIPVYVNERELGWINFVSYDLMSISGLFMIPLVFVVTKLRKW